MRTMKEELKSQGFDILITHRDPETGVVVRQNPYNLIVSGEGRQKLWERPKNSGNVFDWRGEPIGRYVRDAKGKGTYDPLAEHVFVAPPISTEEKAKQALHEKDSRIDELERELSAIKAEQLRSVRQVKPKAAQKADEV